MKKRIMCLLILTVMSVGLAGCSDSDSTEKNTDTFAISKVQESQSYDKVYEKLINNKWMFNGGDDFVLSSIEFKSNKKATIARKRFDGNGEHDDETKQCSYTIDNESIVVTTNTGSELIIKYSFNDYKDTVQLESGYYSVEEIKKSLKGVWYTNYSVWGKEFIKYIKLTDNTVTTESFNETLNDDSKYLFYGPYEGSYTIGFGKIESDNSNIDRWYYNIIDGRPVVLYYDHICNPTDSFPSKNNPPF